MIAEFITHFRICLEAIVNLGMSITYIRKKNLPTLDAPSFDYLDTKMYNNSVDNDFQISAQL